MSVTTKLNELLQDRRVSSVEVNASSMTLHLAGEDTSVTITGFAPNELTPRGISIEIHRTTTERIAL